MNLFKFILSAHFLILGHSTLAYDEEAVEDLASVQKDLIETGKAAKRHDAFTSCRYLRLTKADFHELGLRLEKNASPDTDSYRTDILTSMQSASQLLKILERYNSAPFMGFGQYCYDQTSEIIARLKRYVVIAGSIVKGPKLEPKPVPTAPASATRHVLSETID